MRAKDVDFDVTYINLRDKPDWFLEISPHGKVPVLRVDDQVLFESNAIAEYLDEVVDPRLHPENPIARARNRAWTDFVPTFAAALNGVTYATADDDIQAKLAAAGKVLDRLEGALTDQRAINDGPYFNGTEMSLVDAAYAPFLQRFSIVEKVCKTGLLEGYPLTQAWAETLIGDERVRKALASEFPAEFHANLERRKARAFPLMAGG
jgi:glutathione S-transferase